GKVVKRVEDVLDVWFDSGVATWASLGYPRKKEPFESMWPSAFQTEGPDQFRGWWNSQMITSVLTFGKSPFRSVMMHGFVMDVKGIKLSKSLGNFIDPQDIIDKHGRDAFRFYLLSSPLWNDFYYSWDEMKEVSRMFTVFWNTYSFIKMYAAKAPAAMPKDLLPEDRWIISRSNGLAAKGKDVEEREMHKLVQGISSFILQDLSRTYIKMIRDRVGPWYEGEDKKAAVYALNYALENLLKVMAPISPFVTDMIYRDLYGKESVHLQHWPKADKKLIDADLEEGMAAAMALVEAASAARHEALVKLRWPLSEITVKAADEKTQKQLKALSSVIASMANAKAVKFVKGKPAKAKEFPGGFFALGKVLQDEALLREFCRSVQIKRKENSLMVHDKIHLFVDAEKKALEPLRKQVDELLAGVGAGSVLFGPFEGDEKGTIDFEGSRIRFAFEKA
ncbi:MAG: class I tRNA ligase family protein, partial [Candidatus Aenigmatarchaeota archaeon]